MIYIKYTKDCNEVFEDNKKIPNYIKKLIFKLKSILGKFFVKKISNGELIILPSINKKTLNNKGILYVLKSTIEILIRIYAANTFKIHANSK